MTLYAGYTGTFLSREALEDSRLESLTEVAVYCYIQAFSASEAKGQAYYGTVGAIAETFKISRKTAQRTLEVLEEKGMVFKKKPWPRKNCNLPRCAAKSSQEQRKDETK